MTCTITEMPFFEEETGSHGSARLFFFRLYCNPELIREPEVYSFLKHNVAAALKTVASNKRSQITIAKLKLTEDQMCLSSASIASRSDNDEQYLLCSSQEFNRKSHSKRGIPCWHCGVHKDLSSDFDFSHIIPASKLNAGVGQWLQRLCAFSEIRKVVSEVGNWPKCLKRTLLAGLVVCRGCNDTLELFTHFQKNESTKQWEMWRWRASYDRKEIWHELIAVQKADLLAVVSGLALESDSPMFPSIGGTAMCLKCKNGSIWR